MVTGIRERGTHPNYQRGWQMGGYRLWDFQFLVAYFRFSPLAIGLKGEFTSGIQMPRITDSTARMVAVGNQGWNLVLKLFCNLKD